MPSRLAPHLAALLAALVTLLTSSAARAWVETELLSAESRVEIHRDGTAHVQHKVSFRVRGGPLRFLDLSISDRQISVSGTASLATAGDAATPMMPVPVSIDQKPDGDVRVEIDEKRGVRKGVYNLDFGYDVDLLQAGGLTRDGSMLKVTWMGPKWQDGIDNVKCVLAVPASATAPRPAYDTHDDTTDEAGSSTVGSYLTTIARLPEFDEVTLIRPHVARGESVPWAVRIDPSAIGDVNDPRLHAQDQTRSAAPVPPEQRVLFLGAAALLALTASIGLAVKHRQVTAACKSRGVIPRPLVPLGIGLRVALAGPLLALGVGAQVWLADPTAGSIVVLAVVALTAYRTPAARSAPRGPGRWLPLTDDQAFRVQKPSLSTWLDVSTTSGKVVWLMGTIAWGAGVAATSRFSIYHAHVLALDYVLVASLFWTGLRKQLPADPVVDAAPILGALARSLRNHKALGEVRVSAIARFATGASNPDELRLSIRPRGGLRGFRTIEVGIAWAHGTAGPVPFPQALVRVVDSSACHEAVTARVHKTRWLRGRESYERVLCLTPTLPTLDHTMRLIESLVRIIRDPSPTVADRSVSPLSPQRQPRSSLSRSSRKGAGMSSRTSNAGTDALPLHTTW